MNVTNFNYRHLSAFLLLLLLPAVCSQLRAQFTFTSPYTTLETSIDVPVRDTLAAGAVNLTILQVTPFAQHGEIFQTEIATNTIEIKYKPDAGFVGIDTFVLQLSYSSGGTAVLPYIIYKAYKIYVYPSILNARRDFAYTTIATPVNIDVLANDNGSGSGLSVMSIPQINHGTAMVNADQSVTFTPAAGFVGIAHFNYEVCDNAAFCKTGSVEIGVSNSPTPTQDTLYLATPKNTPVDRVLQHGGYSIQSGSANSASVLMDNGQSFTYTPAAGFTGLDHFVLISGGVTKDVFVDVLHAPTPNTMALDDYFATPTNQPITVNVKTNDIGGLLKVKSFTAPLATVGTLSGINVGANGNVTFTPAPGFNGVASFRYSIGPNSPAAHITESATVYISVGDMNPTASTYTLTTPMESPLVINYEIPFIGWDFAITDPPNDGDLILDIGFSNHVINGQNVTGFNLLTYTPNAGFNGEDEFIVNYCLNGTCYSVKVLVNVVEVLSGSAPYCMEDCVWAGDMNYDGIVNNKDLLPLGYFMGVAGEDRPNASLEWYGQYADNWSNPYAGFPIDLKHIDADGNGAITSDDTIGINLFYGNTHSILPNILPTSKGLPFKYTIPPGPVGVGDLVQVEVELGTTSVPVLNLYGFTFDIQLSPLIIDSAFTMTYYENSWLNANAPFMTLEHSPRQSRLETAFTRTSGVAASGYGKVGRFDYVIIEIIEDVRTGEEATMSIQIAPTTVMGADGNTYTYEGTTLQIPLRLQSETPEGVSDSDFFVYPSPASDLVQVHLNGDDMITSLSVFNSVGARVKHYEDILWEHAELRVSDLPAGIYFVSAQTTSGLVKKKLIVAR